MLRWRFCENTWSRPMRVYSDRSGRMETLMATVREYTPPKPTGPLAHVHFQQNFYLIDSHFEVEWIPNCQVWQVHDLVHKIFEIKRNDIELYDNKKCSGNPLGFNEVISPGKTYFFKQSKDLERYRYDLENLRDLWQGPFRCQCCRRKI